VNRIYGNTATEAMYPFFNNDSTGAPLPGADSYTYRFPPGQLPPVHAFWSLTMYQMAASLLVANPIDRYLINSPMPDTLTKDADGGLTPLHPESVTWPRTGIELVARTPRAVQRGRPPVQPKDEALRGEWKPPQPQKV
jgi:hypothetical protein